MAKPALPITPSNGLQIQAGVQGFAYWSPAPPFHVMWAGNGERSDTRVIVFERPFVTRPTVSLGMSGLNTGNVLGGNTYDTRVDVVVEGVDVHQFTIRVKTWADTKLAMVNVNWLAFGT